MPATLTRRLLLGTALAFLAERGLHTEVLGHVA